LFKFEENAFFPHSTACQIVRPLNCDKYEGGEITAFSFT